MKTLNKSEQLMYPKVMITKYYKHDTDTRDEINHDYTIETTVNNRREESSFYEGLNHEANLVIQVKLPNGVIK